MVFREDYELELCSQTCVTSIAATGIVDRD